MKELTIVTSDSCASCHKLIGDLVKENIGFTELNADHPENYEQIINLGVGIAGLPITVIKDQHNVIMMYRIGYSKKLVDQIKRELK